MDNYEFAYIAKKIAYEIPTRYYLGGWGQQIDGIYLFDCVCLIKSILWGFNFSIGGHGGAIYNFDNIGRCLRRSLQSVQPRDPQ